MAAAIRNVPRLYEAEVFNPELRRWFRAMKVQEVKIAIDMARRLTNESRTAAAQSRFRTTTHLVYSISQIVITALQWLLRVAVFFLVIFLLVRFVHYAWTW